MRDRLAMLCLAGCLAAAASLAAAAPAGPAVGDAAPDFTTKNLLTHDPVTLSRQQGKLVFLSFWASWCAPCRKELPVLEAVQRQLGKERAVVLGVIFHDPDEARLRKWGHEAGWQMTLLEDWDGRIARQYAVRAIPHLYIIGRDGHVLHVHTGYGADSIDQLVAEINAALRDSGERALAAAPAEAAPATAQ